MQRFSDPSGRSFLPGEQVPLCSLGIEEQVINNGIGGHHENVKTLIGFPAPANGCHGVDATFPLELGGKCLPLPVISGGNLDRFHLEGTEENRIAVAARPQRCALCYQCGRNPSGN